MSEPSPETLDEKDMAQAKLVALSFPLGRYQHYKGSFYRVFAVSLDEETLEPLVHYESLARQTFWTRKMSNFMDTVLLPSGEKRARFLFIGWVAGIHE
jgi:hypothetical protein